MQQPRREQVRIAIHVHVHHRAALRFEAARQRRPERIGVRDALAFDELARVAERLHAPVTTSWGARGVFSERSPLAWPMVHVEACTQLRNAADLVLCVGSDVGETDWWGKPPYWAPPARQRWIQVDVDERVLGRNRPLELAVLADAKRFLARLLEALEPHTPALEARRAQVAALAEHKRTDRAALDAALASRSAARATAPAAGSIGSLRRYWPGGRSGSSGPAPLIKSSGTSRCTTPGRPVQHARSAWRSSSGMRAKDWALSDHFAIGRITATWSKHW